MALLKASRRAVVILFPLVAWSRADLATADIPNLIDGYDLSGSSSAAAGDIYTLGVATSFRLGSSDDPANHQTDCHFNYTSDLAPSNPNEPNSPIKHSNNWGGGIKISLWDSGSLGVDYDELNDHFEGLDTNGQKVTLGVEPFKLSYRFGRNTITAPLPGFHNVYGSFIYQHTFELDYDLNFGDTSSIAFDGAYSLFYPPAPIVASLFSSAALATFSNFQDTLQSFEQWKVGGSWNKIWSDYFDTVASLHLSHEIIPANPLWDLALDFGFQLGKPWHLQLGWEYTHDPIQSLNTFSMEIRWSWDRSGEQERGSTTRKQPEAKITSGPKTETEESTDTEE